MPSTSLPIHRPCLALLGFEPLRAACEYLSFRCTRTEAPQGDGHPVVIFPGLGTDANAVAPLHQLCTSIGYTTLDWGRGHNRGPEGDSALWLADLATDMRVLLDDQKLPATLLGWSLGGLYARELACRHARLYRLVEDIEVDGSHIGMGWNPRVHTVVADRLAQRPGRWRRYAG